MTLKTTKLRDAITFALVAGATAVAGTGVAFAQEQEQSGTQSADTLDRVTVTGSRIKRAAVEGAVPITVIDREAIDATGDVSVADYLRNTNFNSFGSFRPQSGSSAQSWAGISLRGLGEGRTLILIDGRRVPTAPNVGSAQDLNSIPLAAVERIEVLTDGASSIYGSDAIGGVVNIITRKDYNGVEVTLGRSFPTRPGGDTEEGSVILGTSGDRGRLLAGVSYSNREIVFQRDRPWSAGGASTFSNNFLNSAGSAFTANPTFGSVVPGGCDEPGFTITGTGASQRCLYDFTFVAADEAQVGNRALFARGDYQINDDWLAYMNASVSRVKSFGRYAPVPSSPWPGGLPRIAPGTPNHPAVRFPGAGYDPNATYGLRHRFAALGDRDTFIESNVYDMMFGFEGRIGEVDLDFGIRRSEFKYGDLGRNYVVGAIAAQYISDGTYDIYNPSANDRDVLNAMIATISRDSTTKMSEIFASAQFDLFEMGGGAARMVVGGEYREDTYADLYDSLSEAGQIVGSAGNSAAGSREVYSAYFETLFPFTTQFEANLSGRYDRYSDYGADFSPKLGLRYQPFDTLTFRASYGRGFRAPTLDILSQQPSFGAAAITHAPTCIAFGLAPTCTTQVTTYSIANPLLQSETSKQWSTGLVWDATDWLNVTLDYYNIKVDDQIAAIGIGTIVACLEGSGNICPTGLTRFPAGSFATLPNAALGLGVEFASDGSIVAGQTGFTNLGFIKTYGFDLAVRTMFDMGAAGNLRTTLQVTNPLHYSSNGNNSVVGRPGVPRYRAVLSNNWSMGDWSVVWNANYIHGTQSTAYRRSIANLNDFGYPHRLPSWLTHDVQLNYEAPWNARITLGVQNLGDKDPVIDPFDPTGRGFDFSLYDGYGRVPYIRYTQRF